MREFHSENQLIYTSGIDRYSYKLLPTNQKYMDLFSQLSFLVEIKIM